ncbi:hypothetical protein [Pseudogemmobacter bohemicus]|uniref:hypothetical protein n=1 Tax=Pseudogemmobacter bohemicus TaxID=2250708 RepID=UPI000DD3FE9C|nr:hypothetical protein [Pseudogemmobacter bohemicus]
MIGLTIYMRRIINATDQGNPEQVASTLASVHENLAVIGGSVTLLTDELGLKEEVDGLVSRNLAKADAFRASSGIEGRA